METKSGAEVRRWLRERGVSVARLAGESNIYSNDLYAFMNGEPLGPTRQARIAAAIERLERETGGVRTA